ncbi:MAG: hypothetical protein CMJ18_06870 [Phycisphaeraceae bacterium]|nr:hypothetical protein [Phycisphaeraceae bacterium]
MPIEAPACLPSEPLAGLDHWATALRRLSRRTLTTCETFPDIAERFERWWTRSDTDRPVFIASYGADMGGYRGRRLELLENEDRWFEAKWDDMRRTRYVGDAIPMIRLDLGPAALGAIVGAPVTVDENTAWTGAFIRDDWANAPDWRLKGEWWLRFQRLLHRVAEHASGRYLVCLPDLGGAADPLLNMRGPESLCMDALEQPERIRAALDDAYEAWRRAIARCYEIVLSHGAGLVHWLMVWSDRPYILPTCDVNFMLGPEAFRDIFLPDLARQAQTVERTLYHLDGPGAARHIDALLEVPAITAIQFTPGAGTPSALEWTGMFRRIQAAGRPLVIVCPVDEVLPICERLEPQGLALIVDPAAPERTEEVFDDLHRRFDR